MSSEIDDNTLHVDVRLYTDDARKTIKSPEHLRQILAVALEDKKKMPVKLDEEIDFTIEVNRRCVQREYGELENEIHLLKLALKQREDSIEQYDHEWGQIWHQLGNPVGGPPLHEHIRDLKANLGNALDEVERCKKEAEENKQTTAKAEKLVARYRYEAAVAKLALRLMDVDDTYGSTEALIDARRQLRQQRQEKAKNDERTGY